MAETDQKQQNAPATPSAGDALAKTDLLNAKFHQGYDPNMEFKERSNVLGQSLSGNEKNYEGGDKEPQLEKQGFLGRILESLFGTEKPQTTGSAPAETGSNADNAFLQADKAATLSKNNNPPVPETEIQNIPGNMSDPVPSQGADQPDKAVSATIAPIGDGAVPATGPGATPMAGGGSMAKMPEKASNPTSEGKVSGTTPIQTPAGPSNSTAPAESESGNSNVPTNNGGTGTGPANPNVPANTGNDPAAPINPGGSTDTGNTPTGPANPGNPATPGNTPTGPANPGGSTDTGNTPTTPANGQTTPLSPPTVTVTTTPGMENQAGALTITVSAGAGAMTIVVIGNVPSGATLSAGTDNGDGSWTLTTGQLTNLTLTPPPYFSGAINLAVTATSSLDGMTASTTTNAVFNITGTPTTPTLSVQNADGVENTPVALNINAALVDNDGSESLSVVIVNVPAGTSLSAGSDQGNGTWLLSPAELVGLTLAPPPYFSGEIDLQITAFSVEAGMGAAISAPLAITVHGVATTPTLSVQMASGVENTAIALNINAALVDTDGETLDVVIAGVPVGAGLSAGHDNGDGTWTLTAAQLVGLQFIPAANASGDVHLTVTAIAVENGSRASVSTALDISIVGVASPPDLALAAASGNEDTAIALSISAALTDNDGSETLGIVIGNIPAGGSLSAGIDNGDGTYTLTAAQLVGLTFTPPAHAAGTYTLSVAATASENGTTSTTSGLLNIAVNGVASMPTLSVTPASGSEDTAIALDIHAALSDNDGSEVLAVIIGNVPAGAALSAGVDNGNGSWTLTAAQLVGLSLQPPQHFSGSLNLSVTAISSENDTTTGVSATLPVTISGIATTPNLSVQAASGQEDTAIALHVAASLADNDGETLTIIIGNIPAGGTLSAGTPNGDGTYTLTAAQLTGLTFMPPAHASSSYSLTVSAIAHENGTNATATSTLTIAVDGVASAPTLDVRAASGDENTPIPLDIEAALTDTDGSESLSIIISNVPAGAVLSAGIDNGDGSWVLTGAQLAGLTLTPPPFYHGMLNLGVAAIASENGSTSTASATLAVSIGNVADVPSLSLSAASGSEDHAIPLVINAAVTNPDSILSITIANVPNGAVLSAGIDNGDGSWTLTPAELTGLTLTPPAHFSGHLSLIVTANADDNGDVTMNSASLGISVAGIATTPSLSVAAALGAEDSAISLNINAALVDTDGSESLSIVLSNVPNGAVLSAGVNNGDGSWTLDSVQLAGLTLTPPRDYNGTLNLGVTAIASENGTTASAALTMPVTINGTADAPDLHVTAATGNENAAIALNITAALRDHDSGETLGVLIGNLPVGAILSAGTDNGDGTWSLTPAQLGGLSITPAANYSGTFNLSVTAVATENGTTASTFTSLGVTVAGVATTPTLSVTGAAGLEDSAIALTINAGLVDTDSETLLITIKNLPAGAVLSAGIDNGDGSYTLTPAQLTGLTFTPPADFHGQVNLTVTATSFENGTSAQVNATLAVTVANVADAPQISVQGVSAAEDFVITLNINAALVDPGSDETLSIVIGNIPAGATLSAGILNGDGTYTLVPGQLSGLTLTPPLNASGSFSLNVTAIATTTGGSAQSVTTLPIVIDGVADAPSLSVAAVSGIEDNAVALNINAALVDADGSESLSVVISGLPNGATLSAGIANGDGSYTLTAAQLSGLAMTPPAHASGIFNLTVSAVASENGTTATTMQTLPVTISGVATPPGLSVTVATGAEDTAISLNIASALVDADGSETLNITISNVPPGGVLSAGTDNGDGTWTLTPSQLAGLNFTPPQHASGLFTLGITASSAENGSTASVNATLPVLVTGVATAPTLAVNTALGAEDLPVALNITAALADTDGSESLAIVITGVPAGAVLSAGIRHADGSYTLAPAQLTGLTLIPASNFNGSFNLGITAISAEAGTTASVSATLPVTIAAVADAPLLALNAASGNEDTPIALNIAASLSDNDAGETLDIVISGIPAGARLSAGTDNGDGSWTLTAAQLGGLTFIPAPFASGEVTLSVTATAAENGMTASVTGTMNVTIAGVATAPLLSVTAAAGFEDHAIALNIASSLIDNDGSESLRIIIAGVPAGATLSAGIDNGDGSHTLTPAQLAGLTFTPPAGASGMIGLTVTARSDENGTVATTSLVLPVTIAGVATTPALSVAGISGVEDIAVPLAINAALLDTDGSETLVVVVSGVPSGASLSAGIHDGNGSWALTPAQLSGLTFTPPANFSGTFALDVTATASENGTSASVHASLPVTIAGIADAPILTLQTVTGGEDSAIALHIGAVLADTDGSESLDVIVTGVPSGAHLSAGTDNGGGSWTLTAAQLPGLSLTPPANFSGTLTLGVTAIASENGTIASTAGLMSVVVNGIADVPTLVVLPASGGEDTAIALAITAGVTDLDGSESLSVIITGIPAGASLSAGINNGNGSWTLTPAQLAGLTLSPPANFSGALTLNVAATASENGTSATVAQTLSITIGGIPDVPILTLAPATGVEDTAIALSIGALSVDADGSEILRIVVAGVPVGAILSAGINNGGGIWTLTAAQLTNLTLTPPANFSGAINLSVTATASENGTSAHSTAILPVNVTGMADAPTLIVQAAAGNEDTAIALNINAALVDLDGSENLSIVVSGVPSGASLSAGTNNGNGSWTLTPAQLVGLTLTPPRDFSGSLSLNVAATAGENGTTATTSHTLTVTVAGVADAPALVLVPVIGTEDTTVGLSFGAALTDMDGSETLRIVITGVPAGATLTAGTDNHDGSWTIPAGQLTGLSLNPPANYSGTFTLGITATALENGTSASVSGSLPVTILGVADAPTLGVLPALGTEDHAIALSINAGLSDPDGSEILSILIGNLPVGATLSAGTNNGNGSWTLSPAQLAGLTLTPPHDFSGTFNLTVAATSAENGTTSTTPTQSLSVTVMGIADAPILSAFAASGSEGQGIALTINAALADTSETLSGITISGMPAGAALSAGLNLGGGTWSLTPAQLTGLTLNPPAHFSGAFALSVVAFSAEDGTTAQTRVSLPVTIAGIASTPLLSVSAASGTEDSAIPLTISSSLTDTDGSESLSVVIGNVPAGAILSAGLYTGSGRWTLAASELAGLKITPPHDFSGTLALQVTAVATEDNGNHTSLTVPLSVTVAPVADTPSLLVLPAAGLEDTAIALNIGTVLNDASETLSVRITGVPTGATLSAGINNGGGSWTLTGGQLANLTLTPAANSNADFTLNIAATSTETNGATATVNAVLPVNVIGVADVPTVTAGLAIGASGNAIALSINGALGDADGSETLTFIVHGVPDGFALNNGINNGDNSWSLTPAQLSGLKISTPLNFNGQLNLYASAVAHENDGSVAVSAATPFNVRIGNYASGYLVDLGVNATIGGIGVGVHVGALPDIDLLPATGGLLTTGGLYVKEDTQKLIADAPGLLGLPVLNGLTTLISRIEYRGVPADVTFSAGTNVGGGVWRFTTAQLNNLYLIPGANSDTDFTITVVAKMLGGLADIGLVSTPVHLMGIADMPTLTASALNGTEGNAVTLNIAGTLTDNDGSETISYLVSGLPGGFMLDKGINNGNGTWSLAATDLGGLHIIPINDFSGTVNLTVSAIATEREGDQTVKQQVVSFGIAAVADTPTIAALHASGNEDQAIALNLGISLNDNDGSERISAVTISGLPTGASLLGATDNHNGTWSVDVAHLNQVQFVPAANWHGDATLNISAVAQEISTGATASATSSLTVHVDAVADTPIATATDSTGTSGEAIGLHVGAALTDTDGSEHLSIVISGIPDDVTLSAGLNNGDGSWTLNASQLPDLSIMPAEHFAGDIDLKLTAYSQDGNNTSVASAQQDFTVHILPAVSMMAMMSAPGMAFAGSENGWLGSNDNAGPEVPAGTGLEAAIAPPPPSDHDLVFQTHSTG